MDATSGIVLTGLVVMAGQWAKQGKGPSIKQVIAVTFLAVILAAMSNANEKLGRQFTVLVLTGAVLMNAMPILEKLGLVRSKKAADRAKGAAR